MVNICQLPNTILTVKFDHLQLIIYFKTALMFTLCYSTLTYPLPLYQRGTTDELGACTILLKYFNLIFNKSILSEL